MFAKNPVLKALGIITSEDIRELSSFQEAIVAFKQAAGGEWVNSEVSALPRSVPKKMGEVLPFPKRDTTTIRDIPQIEEEGEEEPLEMSELTTEFILSQRELSQRVVEAHSTKKAFSEYVDQVKLIVVQDQDEGGKKRIKFVPTHGVLIDKKQS
jgi:hypothetical protein